MSKGFSVIDGDVVIEKTISMVEDEELLRQKVTLVVGTNKGEWPYDTEEGISFPVILRKNPDDAEIMATIEAALKRIDETFVLIEFQRDMNNRNAEIEFRAVNADGIEVGGAYTYGS